MTAEDVERRFQQLVDQVAGLQDAGGGFAQNHSDRGPMLAACTAAHALVSELAPGETSFRPQLNAMMDDLQTRGMTRPSACRHLFVTMKDHFSGGFHRIRELVQSDVFEDLLGMAEYLLGQTYHLPAAALAGAVLEDELRRLCMRHGVTWAEHSSISTLNNALYTADPQVYGKTQMGQIEAWGKLRNDVDHHNFTNPSDIDSNDVGRMIDGVRDFIGKHATA
jgi:hypothetical protein